MTEHPVDLDSREECCENPILSATRINDFIMYVCGNCEKQIFDDVE